eukprot:gene6996-7781_t
MENSELNAECVGDKGKLNFEGQSLVINPSPSPQNDGVYQHERELKIENKMESNVTQLIEFIENIMKNKHSEKMNNNAEIKNILEKLTQLISNLLEKSWEDSGRSSSTNNCLKIFFERDILNEVYNWIAGNKELMRGMTNELLQLYNNILSIGSDSFIRNTRFVQPLLLLLLALRPNEKKRMPHEMELSYVHVLSSLTNRLLDEQFLEQFQKVLITKQGYKLPKYAFVNLLMFYVHEEGAVGNLARDSLIICMQISASNSNLGEFIARESDCCNILAAGLIGFYSALPTTLDVNTEDWYCITPDMISTNKEMQSFVKAIRFCCEIIKFSHSAIRERFLCLIHDGFLSCVLAAAIHQSITEAIIASVAYFELLIRKVTETQFMRVILKFLLTDDYDGILIIDTLIALISTNSTQLCMVTLQLFKTLMDLNCEDIIFHLMIRYLIPCNHLLPNQKRTIKELDFYCKSATMFLYLTPSCCLEFSSTTDDTSDVRDENSPSVCDRRHSKGNLQKSFTKCLSDARKTVRNCKQACQCWSAVYDGMDVMTETPRRSGSSVLISQSQTDRRNSDVFSFALKRGTSITDAEKEDERVRLAIASSSSMPRKTSLKIMNGYSDIIEEGGLSITEGLGPFISAVYEKLGKMPENSFYINLQLTSLISRIASYPQPLLRSLLLNSNLIMQPGVKSLFQILTSIAHIIDAFIFQLDDYKSLMQRARSNLLKRDQKFYGLTTENTARKDSNASGLGVDIECSDQNITGTKADKVARNVNTHIIIRDTSVSSPTLPRKDSLYSEPALEVSHSAGIGRLHPAIRSPSKRPAENLTRHEMGANLKKKNPTAVKNAIYCAIILEEWLKELAAISLEHNVV